MLDIAAVGASAITVSIALTVNARHCLHRYFSSLIMGYDIHYAAMPFSDDYRRIAGFHITALRGGSMMLLDADECALICFLQHRPFVNATLQVARPHIHGLGGRYQHWR